MITGRRKQAGTLQADLAALWLSRLEGEVAVGQSLIGEQRLQDSSLEERNT